jgi:hypothetical protein
MKGFVVPLALVAVVVVGIGFYQGWFQVGSDNAKGKSDVTLSVDKDKIKEDGKTAVAKLEDVGHQIKEKIKEDGKTAVAKVEDVGHQIKDKVEGSGEKSMDGKVVSVSADTLTMTDKDGKEHSHALAANVKVTCDDKTCAVADLKAGMRIRVTADTTSRQTASKIEALDKDQDFKKGA